MDPWYRLFLVAIGAVLGGVFLGFTDHVAGALIGGLGALGAAEFTALRARLNSLELEFKRLGREPRPDNVPLHPAVPEATPPRRTTAQPETTRQDTLQEPPASIPVSQAMATPLPSAITSSPSAITSSTSATTPPAADPEPPRSSRPADEFPLFRWVRVFFTGGNTVVRVGIIILFFGVAFLLRYMAEHTHVPIEWRLTGIALGGVALLVVGWRLRRARAGYGLALQGGAIGILYLTVYAAFRLYGVLPAAVAFPILVAVGVLSGAVAVLQNSLSLALLGVTGGFLAPVLASTGTGSHILLFGYYAVLNAGIVAIAWFKSWRPLNLAGFVFTFGIGTAWGVLQYRPELFGSTEPFLVLFFFFYLITAILFTLRRTGNAGYVDGTLVFGTPIVVFALQAAMLHDRLLPLAYSAVILSAVYLGLAWSLQRRHVASETFLKEAFLALGVAFLTLAVPLALDARWNVAAWSLEGAALVWVGCRQQRVLARLAGAFLALACGLIVATRFNLTLNHALLPLPDYWGVVLQSLASIVSACLLHVYRNRLREFERPLAAALFCWGLVWWLTGGVNEIARFWPPQVLAGSMILFTLTAVAAGEIYRRVGLPAAKLAALLQFPMMAASAVVAIGSLPHPAAAAGWLGWPLAFIGLYGLLYRLERDPRTSIGAPVHAGAAWLFCGILGWEVSWQTNRVLAGSAAWPTAAWAVIPMVGLWVLPGLVARVSWPFIKHRAAYLHVAGAGLAIFLCGWSVVANLTTPGDFAPLPYFPLLNPIDLMQGFVLVVLLRCWQLLRTERSATPRSAGLHVLVVDRRVPVVVLSALTFLWLNAMLIRTLHQWFGVAYDADALLSSTLVQTSLSIFWALLAFAAMVLATRRSQRMVWLVGATLLGVVIGKLFLIDLSRVGSIERIVSFVGVGVLMLVIGYLSPLPPAAKPAS